MRRTSTQGPRRAVVGSRLVIAALLGIAVVAASACAVPNATTLKVVVPAYVWPTEPLVTSLLDPDIPPPAVVILNIGNGDGDVAQADATAEKLRARRTAAGEPVKVLGYIWTSTDGADWSSRPEAEILASIDRWLSPRGGRVHYDGIFVDHSPVPCGRTAGSMDLRDKYLRIRNHVTAKLPGAFVANNPGTAPHICYLEPGKRTADVFVTFEGTEQAYFQTQANTPGGWWLGGNVTDFQQYLRGDLLTFTDANGQPYQASVGPESYWHLVHGGTAGREQATADLARSRFAGGFTSSLGSKDTGDRNPWGNSADPSKIPAHLRALGAAAAAPPA